MKRIILSIVTITIATSSFGQKVVADKIVAVVGDKIVLQSDIANTITDMKRQGMEIPDNADCLTLEQAMSIKAMVLQAEKDSLIVTDEEISADIDNQVRYFIGAYGSKEELEKISGKTIYQLKEDFKDGFRERKLAAAMRNSIVEGIKITPKEVGIYYDKIPKDSLSFYESELEIGQIVIYPKASRDAEEYCKEELNSYKKQIESGKRDFKLLAALYSEDPGSKDNAGQYEINRNEKQWDPVFMAKAFGLKEGQVSAPFKTRFGYHIIQMINRAGDDAIIRHILKIPPLTKTELNEANDKLDSVRSKLIVGTIDFGEAVAKYSEDESSKFTGGRIQGQDGSTYITIDQLDKDIVLMIKNLKTGQYSQPVEFTDERGKRGVRIVYLMSKSEPHRENMKDDYDKISQRALAEKRNIALEEWFFKKIGTYYVFLDDKYKDCEEMQKWVQANKKVANED